VSARQTGKPYDKDLIATIFKHAFTEALFEGAQGGNMFHGAITGALSTAGEKSDLLSEVLSEVFGKHLTL